MAPADLFSWREEAEAEARKAAAAEIRAQAAMKARVAPHGQVRARQDQLKAATLEALRAELALERVRKGGSA
ncbi:MAG: hypothetical protein ACK41C_10355 [Phenylobacterium sp.]|uniref:hypothetical protein n=1 Tax=Phenylobacterium sp. TaxID=1871053 RepID=UPI00391C7C78